MKNTKNTSRKIESGISIEVLPNTPKNEFFKTPVEAVDDEIIIRLPRDFADLVETENGEAYCIVLNGILQVSGARPVSAIPVLASEEFTEERI